jgi:NYN domain-containing protein
VAVSTRVFIDFWNFQLAWNDRAGGSGCDWPRLPSVLAAAAQGAAPQLGQLQVDDTRVYASYEPGREAKLAQWLDSFLDRLPGFRVFTRERKASPTSIHCRSCDQKLTTCPNCSARFMRAGEKGVDAAIITDMFSLALENAYQVAIIVTGDGDLVPAVEKIQDKGFKIVNATWKGYGHNLAKKCWASFNIDPLVASLTRTT